MPPPADPTSRPSPSFLNHLLTFLFRFFFKLLYHQLAFTYDWVAAFVSVGLWHSWVSSTIPYLDGPRILEIGFGPGHLQTSLHQKGLVPFGLDESVQMGSIAKKRLARLGFSARFVRSDALYLPFAARSFRQVVLTFPSEFILKPSALAEIRRVLDDGGLALILPFAWVTGQKPFEKLAAWITRLAGQSPKWDKKSLQPLENRGFDVSAEILDLPSSRVLLVKLLKS